MYNQCFIEQYPNSLWYIVYPDGTKAWRQGYKTNSWASRVLNWLKNDRRLVKQSV